MQNKPKNIPTNSKFLEGIGESAWFNITKTSKKNEYEISRYTVNGNLECENIFILKTMDFNILEEYKITYVSHCARCTVMQNEKEFIFILK